MVELKRKRSRVLEDEYGRQMECLNRSFQQWVESNKEANPVATWEEGCHDYCIHAEHLKSKFCTEGLVWAFGTGDCGQLGFGVDGGEEDMFVPTPREVRSLKGKNISALCVGGMHNAIVTAEDGIVYTWGCSDDGSLGREGDENYPAPVKELKEKVFVVQLSAGDCHTCALTVNGQVYVWGSYRDKDGKNWFPHVDAKSSFKHAQSTPWLLEDTPNANVFSKHGGAVQIASGASHTLALCGDGTVYSWGIGEVGQLGRPVCQEMKDSDGVYKQDEVYQSHLIPQVMQYAGQNQPKTCTNARFIGTGSYHSFVVQAVRSRVAACGLNQYGQLALPVNDVTSNYPELNHVPALDSLHIASLNGGEHHSLALTRDGQVYTFGRSDSGQLGVDQTAEMSGAGGFTNKPQLVKIPKTISDAVCGSFHCAALADDGTLYTWGYGEMAQLGHGDVKDSTKPRVLEGVKVTAVGCGAQHTIILKNNA